MLDISLGTYDQGNKPGHHVMYTEFIPVSNEVTSKPRLSYLKTLDDRSIMNESDAIQ